MRELTFDEQNQIGGGGLVFWLGLLGGIAAAIEIYNFFKGGAEVTVTDPRVVDTIDRLGDKCIMKGNDLEFEIDGQKAWFSCQENGDGTTKLESEGESIDVDEDYEIIEEEPVEEEHTA